jgi:hypothetical protein
MACSLSAYLPACESDYDFELAQLGIEPTELSNMEIRPIQQHCPIPNHVLASI